MINEHLSFNILKQVKVNEKSSNYNNNKASCNPTTRIV